MNSQKPGPYMYVMVAGLYLRLCQTGTINCQQKIVTKFAIRCVLHAAVINRGEL